MWRLLGCVAPGPYGEHPPPVEIGAPVIESFSVACDVDAGLWTLDAIATTWTGGGNALWSEDLVYVEAHAVPVAESAPDAGPDELVLVLAIVNDWRAQAPNSSTVFTCADDPNVVFTLYDVDGGAADCVVIGPDAAALAELPEDPTLCRTSGEQ
jgi:hypothetical protein